MKGWLKAVITSFGLVAAGTAGAQDFELEFSEEMLNELVAELGSPSNGGIYRMTMEIPGLLEDCVPVGYLDCPTIVPGSSVSLSFRIPLVRCEGRGGQIVVSPNAEPIAWQWWVTDASFDVQSGKLEFSATVRYHVNGKWFREDRTVPAALEFDSSSQSIRVKVEAFQVPIKLSASTARGSTQVVDVSRLMSFSIPVHPPTFSVPKLAGGTKTIRSEASLASVQYLPTNRIRIALNVQYN